MIATALIVIVVAVALIRLGWAGRRGAAAAGWAACLAALVTLGWRDGAWGVATGFVVGMGAALALVLQAGWTSPAKTYRPARLAPLLTLPHRWRETARRLSVFVLAVPVAFAAAQWLAFAVQALARRGGAGAADATVLALFLQPMLWCTLMAWQMTRATAPRMLAPPGVALVLGTVLWSLS